MPLSATAVRNAKPAKLKTAEGLNLIRIRIRHIPGSVDLPTHHYHRSLTHGLWRNRHSNRIEQIPRPVGIRI